MRVERVLRGFMPIAVWALASVWGDGGMVRRSQGRAGTAGSHSHRLYSCLAI